MVEGGIVMTSSTLKILACVIMLIDHVGLVFFPQYIGFRVIGRLAFPIFAYFIAEGHRRTRDVTDYLGRLFVFALVSQLPFVYAFNTRSLYLNVFFTLAAGLYAIYAYDKNKKLYVVILIAAVCQLVSTDYGAYGVVLVFLFNKYHDDFKRMALNVTLFTIIFQLIEALGSYFTVPSAYLGRSLLFTLAVQPLCLLSLILIKKYNGKKGLRLKYLFYGFYPVHLTLIWLLREIMY